MINHQDLEQAYSLFKTQFFSSLNQTDLLDKCYSKVVKALQFKK